MAQFAPLPFVIHHQFDKIEAVSKHFGPWLMRESNRRSGAKAHSSVEALSELDMKTVE